MRRVLLVLVVGALMVSGCGRGKDAAKSSPGPVSSLNPNLKESKDDKLPAGFPSDFPLPKDRKVLYSAESDQGTVVFFASGESSDRIRDQLAAELPKNGWQLVNCTKTPLSPEPITVLLANKNDRLASVAIGYIELPKDQRRFEGKYSFYVSVIKSQQALPTPSAKVTCA